MSRLRLARRAAAGDRPAGAVAGGLAPRASRAAERTSGCVPCCACVPRTAPRCWCCFADRLRLRAGAGAAGTAVDPRHALEMDAAAAARVRCSTSLISALAMAAGTVVGHVPRASRRLSLLRPVRKAAWLTHAFLPQRAVAGAAVLLHVPAAVPGHAVRRRRSRCRTGSRRRSGLRCR